MKFGKRFREEIVPEWKAMYMDYKGLKKRLRNVQRERLLMPNKQQKIRSSRVSVNSYNAQEDERTEYSSRYKRYSGQSQVTQITQITNVAGSVQDFFHKVSSALVSLQKQPPLQSDDILPPAQITSLNTLKEEVNPREVIFFSALDGELEKVEEFYKTKEDEASNRMELLMQSYEMLKERRDVMLKEMTGLSKNENKRSVELWNTPKAIFKRSVDFFASQDTPSTLSMASQKDSDILSSPDELLKHFKIAKDNIKKAIFEFYRGTELLRKYRALNYSGFRKILKKYDKVSERNGSQIYMKKVISSHFVRSDTVKKLLKKAEDFYVNHFENGSRPQALRKLRMPNKKNKTYYPSTLRTGLYLGLTLPALIGSLVLGVNNQRYSLLELYSGIFLPIFLLLLLSIDMYVWTRSRINYKFIIELDLRDNLDFRQYMELPAITLLVMSSIMFVSFMEGFFANELPWPAAIFIGAIILNPFPVFYYNARRWFILSTMRLLGSGLLRVEFRDFFIADIFTSLSYSMISYQLFDPPCRDHVTCDIRTRAVTPILGSIPALFRLLQCCKRYYDTSQKVHVMNLCKYASIIVSVVMTYIYRIELGTEHEATARIAWCLAQSIAAIYTFSWDVKVDWSLLQLRSVNYLLRDELGYEHHWLYYGAIIADLFLRFTWILFIYWPKERGVSFCIALGEVIRRLIWVCFRIENEHIVNCREFRAVKELPLPFQSDILTGHASDDENIDYDRSTSFTSWSTWSKKIFTKDSRPRNNSLRGNDPADNWKDFEPRKNLVYPHQEIYEERESDDDSDYEEDIDDKHELTSRRKKSISISRMEEGYGLSNAYASRSFYPVNE